MAGINWGNPELSTPAVRGKHLPALRHGAANNNNNNNKNVKLLLLLLLYTVVKLSLSR